MPEVIAVDREELGRLLVDGSGAAEAARAALRDGGTFTVSDGATPAWMLAGIYGRRLRRTRRIGQQTLGLEEAVMQLKEHERPVVLGQITTGDGSWTFMLFLTEGSEALVTCTGVRRPASSTKT